MFCYKVTVLHLLHLYTHVIFIHLSFMWLLYASVWYYHNISETGLTPMFWTRGHVDTLDTRIPFVNNHPLHPCFWYLDTLIPLIPFWKYEGCFVSKKTKKLPAAQCPGSLHLSLALTFSFIPLRGAGGSYFFISLMITCMSAVEILPSLLRS